MAGSENPTPEQGEPDVGPVRPASRDGFSPDPDAPSPGLHAPFNWIMLPGVDEPPTDEGGDAEHLESEGPPEADPAEPGVDQMARALAEVLDHLRKQDG